MYLDGSTALKKLLGSPGSHTPSDFALQYDPPAGYGYKWSGD
jgi:hypothetical protein